MQLLIFKGHVAGSWKAVHETSNSTWFTMHHEHVDLVLGALVIRARLGFCFTRPPNTLQTQTGASQTVSQRCRRLPFHRFLYLHFGSFAFISFVLVCLRIQLHFHYVSEIFIELYVYTAQQIYEVRLDGEALLSREETKEHLALHHLS